MHVVWFYFVVVYLGSTLLANLFRTMGLKVVHFHHYAIPYFSMPNPAALDLAALLADADVFLDTPTFVLFK